MDHSNENLNRRLSPHSHPILDKELQEKERRGKKIILRRDFITKLWGIWLPRNEITIGREKLTTQNHLYYSRKAADVIQMLLENGSTPSIQAQNAQMGNTKKSRNKLEYRESR